MSNNFAHFLEVIILDEPTSGLDSQCRLGLLTILSDLRRLSELTIVVSTHCVQETMALADRVVVIDQGQAVFTGTPHECNKKYGSYTFHVSRSECTPLHNIMYYLLRIPRILFTRVHPEDGSEI